MLHQFRFLLQMRDVNNTENISTQNIVLEYWLQLAFVIQFAIFPLQLILRMCTPSHHRRIIRIIIRLILHLLYCFRKNLLRFQICITEMHLTVKQKTCDIRSIIVILLHLDCYICQLSCHHQIIDDQTGAFQRDWHYNILCPLREYTEKQCKSRQRDRCIQHIIDMSLNLREWCQYSRISGKAKCQKHIGKKSD